MAAEITAVSNGASIERFFGVIAAKALPVAQESMMAAGELLVEEIKARISTDGAGVPSAPGSPPALQSGAYYDSWGPPEPIYGPAQAGIGVGTDSPYARRLEWGFVGTDSLGRVYNQAPRPHVGPALDQIEPLLADDLIPRLLAFAPGL